MKQSGIRYWSSAHVFRPTPLTVRGPPDGTIERVAGRYESWFLSARDAEPGRAPRAVWLRHTRHRPAGAVTGTAALWCTVFAPAEGAPAAVKESVAEFPATAIAGPARFRGEAHAR